MQVSVDGTGNDSMAYNGNDVANAENNTVNNETDIVNNDTVNNMIQLGKLFYVNRCVMASVEDVTMTMCWTYPRPILYIMILLII